MMFLVAVDLPDRQMENVTEIQMLPGYTELPWKEEKKNPVSLFRPKIWKKSSSLLKNPMTCQDDRSRITHPAPERLFFGRQTAHSDGPLGLHQRGGGGM